MKKLIIACMVLGLLVGTGSPAGAVLCDYYIWNDWGGTWADAEKTLPNTEDDLMCWAAAASNILGWTGWGNISGMTNTDQIFKYFQDHWTDNSGLVGFGWEWWFTGTNPSQGRPGWSQVDVPGGGFYPALNFDDYYHETWSTSQALSAIDTYLHNGWGTALSIYDGGHAITCWGFRYDPTTPNYYTGIWVTDSDDDKNGPSPCPDRLRYYDVQNIGGIWYLENFYGTCNEWYIEGIQGLKAIPEPATICLLTLGGLVVVRRRK